ncbi:HlyD family efflux transporter periplasmic adaptor subunit [Stieleria sp. JC731]|uniref:efflux RND transporter periplasmic adaptor subunit n=1 Tax=Pirellulaceae TaxID=2691357 RepID=UPI001E64DCD8|nr:HlyD family efflux transporter periplasmic adaptor subunit [Stieleria sp. JC731]MCC9600885.1 HlyD family efflux transporter periplasmic adaptor subunit [Stieleria sp. JC731]
MFEPAMQPTGTTLSNRIPILGGLILSALAGCMMTGCSKRAPDIPPKAPRPVTVMKLQRVIPEKSFSVSGSVTSWKTEQIGFEVGGRVMWVLEPGKNIDGRTLDADGNVIQEGTPLAAIDPAQYEVAVDSAQASLEAAQLDAQVIAQRISDSIPADIRSSQADLKLAKSDYERMQQLRNSNAASQSEYEDAQNRLSTEQARLDRLESSKAQAEVELKAAEARVKAAKQTLRNAQRDLDNTVLYASYPGQISEVQVVPGSVVSAGSPVLTLQMINPIKVAIEVSAEQSRDLERRRQLSVSFVMPDGSPAERNAMVYSVSPSADPSTRTFSVSLLIMNEQYRSPLSEIPGGESFARTEDIWPLKLNKIIGAPESILVIEENSIESDDQGDYVWVATNARYGQRLKEVTTVEKHYVTVLNARIPFLGNWIFRPVLFQSSVNDQSLAIDRESLIIGALEYPMNDRSKWDGKSVVVDGGAHWMLRPGDLVNASLADGQPNEGYYVPVEAIYEESGRTYVFMVEDDHVKQSEIRTELPNHLNAGSLIQIHPLAGDDFPQGCQIVVKGVHFLMDGESINVITSELPSEEMPVHTVETDSEDSAQ